jgi:peptide/nickel transport system permease protein
MADTAIVTSPAPKAPAAALRTRFFDSDLWASFKRSKVTMAAAFVTALFFAAAVLAGVLSPQNPFDPAQLELLNSRVPPLWESGGQAPFLLGTDQQGRDMLSAILYGLRISLVVGVLGVAFSATLGIALGLIAGYFGGAVDTVIMRIADVQLTFPAILIALLIDGVVKSVLGNQLDAGTVLGVLPNVLGPVLVIATINLALAVITEATLSFLGSGMPQTMPSLGTLIRIGNNFLFSGEWWIVAFPGIALAGLVLAINLLGDWLRDALNPRLR